MSEPHASDSWDAFERSDWEQPDREQGENDHATIEAMVRHAGRYIRPSDDLRPRVLEAAKEHSGDCRAERRLGNLWFALALLLVFVLPAIHQYAIIQSDASIHAAGEVARRAEELASHPEIGVHWSLAEAFSQWRTLTASRLGASRLGASQLGPPQLGSSRPDESLSLVK
jgi:hypothetical protein